MSVYLYDIPLPEAQARLEVQGGYGLAAFAKLLPWSDPIDHSGTSNPVP